VLKLHGELVVPLPALIKPIVAPIVLAENQRLIEKYLVNLARHFGGRV
jgi:hypothetical protein